MNCGRHQSRQGKAIDCLATSPLSFDAAVLDYPGDIMKKETRKGIDTGPPSRFRQFGKKYPGIMSAFEALSAATYDAGPLDARTCALAKLAISVGSWREGAVHSHTRRALEAGCTPDEIRHVVLLATTTLGFPSTMAAMTWVEDILSKK